MRMRMTWLLTSLIVWPALAAEPLELTGKIDAVTVYRGQALVTRLVDIPGPAGLREITITDLPEQILPGSIHAETADELSVRSVRYRVRPVDKDVRDEVRELDAKIDETNNLLRANQRFTEETAERKAYLERLETFTAATANVELTQGVLNAPTVRELTEFIFKAREDLANGQLELEREQKTLASQLELLQRKRNELTGGSNRVVREAVIFIDLPNDAGGKMRLRYLVNNSNWSPSYNVRHAADQDGLLVEYNASIEQMSGEDWTDVETTLSTATPSLVAKAPTLEPMQITLRHPSQVQLEAQAAMPKGYNEARMELYQQKLQVDNRRVQKGGMSQQRQMSQMAARQAEAAEPQLDLELNQVANDLQVLDLVSASRSQLREAREAQVDEGISVSYSLASRTSLPSRSDRQLVQIAALPVGAEFYKVATPVLTSFVYDEAR
ncbi:MAG: mucoidy inhibitor MuiA family protein, partial [Phycisphaerae bacterium]|nr:mucoidy inhibitor MuiA family protein [Phycisphaerae bacterium]